MTRSSTIHVSVPAEYAAEIAEVFHKRLLVLNYEHEIEVDEDTQTEQALAREVASAVADEEARAEAVRSMFAFDVVT